MGAIRRFLIITFWLVAIPIANVSILSAQSIDIDKLPRKWINQNDSSSYLLLNNLDGQQFEWATRSGLTTGEWKVSSDNLLLIYDLQPALRNIDSVRYIVEGGQPFILFYREGVQIAAVGENGLVSDRHSDTLQIAGLSDKKLLLLTKEGDSLTYNYQPDIPDAEISFNDIFRGILGILSLLGICFLLSADRKRIDWQLVGMGILLQLVFALLVLKVGFVRDGFEAVSSGFVRLLDYSAAGAAFLFGGLMDVNSYGFIFAFQVLPTIIFFSALSSVLYYLGILQRIVFVFAWAMSKTMRLSGAESLAAAANIFIGQTEAPLVVKPYLANMTKSELLCLMVGGMATIAGGVFAAFITFLGGDDPAARQYFAMHLLTASILSAPAAIVAAKMLYPEREPEKIDRNIKVSKDKIGSNILDAISIGTTDGLKLAVNVAAMLLTFTALMYMVNQMLLWAGGVAGLNDEIISFTDGRFDGLSLDFLLGMLFAPVAWLLGTPWVDSQLVGQLLGKKTIINEFFAYESMHTVKEAGQFTYEKSIIIATYALCGFANFASIGIQIGGIGVLAPNQRKNLAQFGIRALLGGTVAAFLTAAIAGMLV